MTLDQKNIKVLDKILSQKNISRSKFIDSLIKNSIFVINNIKDNPSYYLVEQILTDFYKWGLISYYDLVKVIGPTRSREVHQLIRTTKKFKEWQKE